uniref:Uncharacterized protein n=1 Tax=Romanomermis culicivorax TaxID=13658 RepID=A0A915JI85_ROMCU
MRTIEGRLTVAQFWYACKIESFFDIYLQENGKNYSKGLCCNAKPNSDVQSPMVADCRRQKSNDFFTSELGVLQITYSFHRLAGCRRSSSTKILGSQINEQKPSKTTGAGCCNKRDNRKLFYMFCAKKLAIISSSRSFCLLQPQPATRKFMSRNFANSNISQTNDRRGYIIMARNVVQLKEIMSHYKEGITALSEES